MDAKKLQQLQQQQHQKKIPLAYQTNINDYRTATHSPVFQQQQHHQQQQQQQSYHMHHLSGGGSGYQQSPTTTSNSSSGPLTPIDIQPQANKLLLKHHMSNTSSSSQHSSPYHQPTYAGSSGEQLYQSPPERAYLAAAGRLQAIAPNNASTTLQQQYQQLQQAKMQAQLQTQSEAVQQQQRTFAMRQQINPPVPQGHYHMSQSSSMMSAVTQQTQQQSPATLQRAPPSTLNLSSQFQPATGPLKVSGQLKSGQSGQQQHYQQQEQSIYAQQQQQLQLQLQLQHQQQLQQQEQHQRLKAELQTPGGTEHSPVYIQQNHPGHVTNQACQTQISAVKTAAGGMTSKTPSSEDSASRSPAHAPLDRKKSTGSIQAIKSPMTKRPPSSSVSISGWLYKQGSDGLKVWRKRWFVLAEYCLYYYKGPEEEKLLGSILLPSYRVSACLPEDRIYRKYAFKCEHQNMRTYWLAAETAESMIQWVRALTAATMMQAPSSGESDQTSQPSASSSLNHSGENSDSGIHTLQSQQSKMSLNQGPVTPASDNANAQSASSSNSGGAQPLYANAPPKPRRINDGGYSSPSPEHSIDNERNKQPTSRRSGVMSPTLQQQQLYQQQLRSQQHHAIYDTRTGNVTSTLRLQQQQQHQLDNLDAQFQQQLQFTGADDYAKSPPINAQQYMDMEEQILRLQQQQQRAVVPDDLYGERELHMQKLIQQRYAGTYPNAERRTPDAYGRSKNRVFSDYEDIYNLNQNQAMMQDAATAAAAGATYRRPMSPPSYESNKHVPSMPARYTPNHVESTHGAEASLSSNHNLRSRSATAAIVRPHSADFLEYEARVDAVTAHPSAQTSQVSKTEAMRTPRPKSSLDINRTPDSVYYSEASYAEKMRKSALYLQNPQTPSGSSAQPQQPPSAVYRAGANDIYSPGAINSGMNTIGYENPYERVYKRSELLAENKGAASMPRMSRSTGSSISHAAVRSASTHPHHQLLAQQQRERELLEQQQQYYQSPAAATATTPQQYMQQNEQFLRSASARLPKRGGYEDEYVSGGAIAAASPTTAGTTSHQDGERKREESMKRLLEWKQRMLQSPLTRKGIQQTVSGGPASNMTAMSKLGSNPNILLASTAVASGALHPKIGKGGNALVGGVCGIQRSRSETHANGGAGGYNSYSSDDEDGSEVKPPAGRSTTATTRHQAKKFTDTSTASSVSKLPTSSGSSTKATTISVVDTRTNKQKQQQQLKTQIHANISNTNKSSCSISRTRVNTKATETTVTTAVLATTKTIATTTTNTNPIQIQKLITTPVTKTKQIVVKPVLKMTEAGEEPEIEEDIRIGNTIVATKTSTVSMTAPTASEAEAVTNRLILTQAGRNPGAILRSPTALQLNIEAVRREQERAFSRSTEIADDLAEVSTPDLAKEVPIVPKKPAPKSPLIANYTPVYTMKLLTAGESKILKDNQASEELDTLTESLVKPAEEASAEFIAIQEVLTPAASHTEKKSMNKEETPMLISLQAFKATHYATNQQLSKEVMPAHIEEEKAQEVTVCGVALESDTENINSQLEQQPNESKYDTAEDDGDADDTDTACEEYTDDDLDEALAEEEDDETPETSLAPALLKRNNTQKANKAESLLDVIDVDDENAQIYENEIVTSEPHEQLHNEGHYLPMTPKKIESNPSGTLTLVSLNDSIETNEENPYVEMSKGLHYDESKSNYETVCIGAASILLQATSTKAKQLHIQTEPVYMELTQGKHVEAAETSTNTVSTGIGALESAEQHNSSGRSTLKKQSCKKNSETLKKKMKKSTSERIQSKRKDLPDILKPSQSSLAISTDSSDADDESSKQIDAKKLRSRSRFSLSDTFRPASYYLGANTQLANCAESSDSEIVSPPPIPSSPPPMEELNTEEIFSSENYDTVKRRDSSNSGNKFNLSYEQLPKLHTSNSSLNIAKPAAEATLKSSRLSLPDQFNKLRGSAQFKTPNSTLLKQHERTLSDSNYSFQTDNSSNTSSDFDLYNKLKQNSPSFIASPLRYQSNSSLPQKLPTGVALTASTSTGGDSSETDSVEFRQRQGSDSELERHRSRRPLSEESISEIELMNERFEESLTSTDLDTYLNQLQTNDLYLYQNTTTLDAATVLINEATATAGAGILTNLIKPPEIFRNKDDGVHFYGNINFVSSTDSLQKMENDRKLDTNDAIIGSAIDLTMRPTPIHSRNNSNISEQSAPYYYSELLNTSRDAAISTPPLTTLNNQRDVHAQSGSNIEHINNPIKQHANLNPAAMDMLTEKNQTIDSKNLYKIKTNNEKLSYSSGKNLKSGESFNQASTSTQAFHLQQLQCPLMKLSNFQTNLYHTTQQQDSSVGNMPTARTDHNRLAKNTNVEVGNLGRANSGDVTAINMSGSITSYGGGGGVDHMGLSVTAHNRATTAAAGVATQLSPTSSKSNAKKLSFPGNRGASTTSGPGELLWEEDTLWRESLRRVSQRHARSLDDLDRIAASPKLTVKHAELTPQTKTRLSREVTYVNDNISQHLRASFRPRLSEPSAIQTTAERLNEHDVYVQLSETLQQDTDNDACSDVYEVLREDSVSSGFSQKYSGDMDRETLRQWDSMSSGLMKNITQLVGNEAAVAAAAATTTASTSVKNIIQQLNASCDDNGNSRESTPETCDANKNKTSKT